MQLSYLGNAQKIVIDGTEHDEGPSLTFAVFAFSGTWDEAKGVAAAKAMLTAGNAIAGGTVTVTAATQALTAVAPHLASPTLTAAASAADEVLAAQQSGGLTVASAIPIALHFAANDGLLTGDSAAVSNVVAGMLSVFLARK